MANGIWGMLNQPGGMNTLYDVLPHMTRIAPDHQAVVRRDRDERAYRARQRSNRETPSRQRSRSSGTPDPRQGGRGKIEVVCGVCYRDGKWQACCGSKGNICQVCYG